MILKRAPTENRIGAKVVTHARYVIFQMAEVAIARRLFAAILERIQRLRRPGVGVVPSG
jgi:hypothetical protein